jgi:hypothetical protein
MAGLVVAIMVKELYHTTTLLGLKPYVSKPFFILCSSHSLQFLCTCGSSIVAHTISLYLSLMFER